MDNEARPDQARVTEHKREKPHDALRARLICELDHKARKVDLRLLARRGLEPHLKGRDRRGPDVAHRALHGRVAASVTAFT
jgi:hypothetical protein